MGRIIPFFQKTLVHGQLLNIVMRDLAGDAVPLRRKLLIRVERALSHAQCPDLHLTQQEQARLNDLLSRLDSDPHRKQEAYLASIFRMGAVHGWNPNHTWPLRKQDLSLEARLILEVCYGMIGLVWQIKYCKEIALNFEDNKRLISH